LGRFAAAFAAGLLKADDYDAGEHDDGGNYRCDTHRFRIAQ
jgi:hypothetical protein